MVNILTMYKPKLILSIEIRKGFDVRIKLLGLNEIIGERKKIYVSDNKWTFPLCTHFAMYKNVIMLPKTSTKNEFVYKSAYSEKDLYYYLSELKNALISMSRDFTDSTFAPVSTIRYMGNIWVIL